MEEPNNMDMENWQNNDNFIIATEVDVVTASPDKSSVIVDSQEASSDVDDAMIHKIDIKSSSPIKSVSNIGDTSTAVLQSTELGLLSQDHFPGIVNDVHETDKPLKCTVAQEICVIEDITQAQDHDKTNVNTGSPVKIVSALEVVEVAKVKESVFNQDHFTAIVNDALAETDSLVKSALVDEISAREIAALSAQHCNLGRDDCSEIASKVDVESGSTITNTSAIGLREGPEAEDGLLNPDHFSGYVSNANLKAVGPIDSTVSGEVKLQGSINSLPLVQEIVDQSGNVSKDYTASKSLIMQEKPLTVSIVSTERNDNIEENVIKSEPQASLPHTSAVAQQSSEDNQLNNNTINNYAVSTIEFTAQDLELSSIIEPVDKTLKTKNEISDVYESNGDEPVSIDSVLPIVDVDAVTMANPVLQRPNKTNPLNVEGSPEVVYNLPLAVMGRSVENPDDDYGPNLQKSRPGVKIPFRNLTSQIVTRDELAQELYDRASKTYKSPPVGDIFLAKKMTRRLASHVTQGNSKITKPYSEISASSNAGSKPIKTPIEVSTTKPLISVKETKVSDPKKKETPLLHNTGNDDLLAILEGEVDDWSIDRPPPQLIAATAIVNSPINCHDKPPKLDPAVEKELALRQLSTMPRRKKKELKISTVIKSPRKPKNETDSGEANQRNMRKRKMDEGTEGGELIITDIGESIVKKPLRFFKSRRSAVVINGEPESKVSEESNVKSTTELNKGVTVKTEKLNLKAELSKNLIPAKNIKAEPVITSTKNTKTEPAKIITVAKNSKLGLVSAVSNVKSPKAELIKNIAHAKSPKGESLKATTVKIERLGLNPEPIKEVAMSKTLPKPKIEPIKKLVSKEPVVASIKEETERELVTPPPRTYSSRIKKSTYSDDFVFPSTSKSRVVPLVCTPKTVTVTSKISETPKISPVGSSNLKSMPIKTKKAPVKTKSPKKQKKKVTEIDRLLADEGAINMLYSVEQQEEQRRSGGKDTEPVVKKRLCKTTRYTHKALLMKTRLVKSAVQRLKSVPESSVRATRTGPRKTSIDSPSSPTQIFTYPPRLHPPAEASRIIRRHSSSSNFSSRSTSPNPSSRRLSMDTSQAPNADQGVVTKPASINTRKRSQKVYITKLKSANKSKKKKSMIEASEEDSIFTSQEINNGVDKEEDEREVESPIDKTKLKSQMAKNFQKITKAKPIQLAVKKLPDLTTCLAEAVTAFIAEDGNVDSSCLPPELPKDIVKSGSLIPHYSSTISSYSSLIQSLELDCIRRAEGTSKEPVTSTQQFINVHDFKEIKLLHFEFFIQIVISPVSTKPVNSFNLQVLRELHLALNLLRQNDCCRLVLVTSTEEAFCMGIDLQSLIHENYDMRKTAAQDLADALKQFMISLSRFNKPLIAGVRGAAVGLGVTMLPFFDIVIASTSATFYTPYAKLGQMPEGAAVVTFPHFLGNAGTKELLYACRKMTATEAKQYGLVTRVTGLQSFKEDLLAFAETVASQSAQSMEAMKALLCYNLQGRVEEALECESTLLVQHWTSIECQQKFKQYFDEG